MNATEPATALKFNEADHTYWINGLKIPGITELLRYWGYIDSSHYVSEVPRDIGTAVHAGTSAIDKGTEPQTLPFTDPRILNRIYAWQDFREQKQYMPGLIESMQYSEVHSFACRLDRYGYIGSAGAPAIIDIKCGAEQPWHALQTAGQEICLERTIGDTFSARRFCVYLRPDGSYRLREHKRPEDIAVVRGLAGAYWYNKTYNVKRMGD